MPKTKAKAPTQRTLKGIPRAAGAQGKHDPETDCVKCSHRRPEGAPFFKIFLFMQTVGVKPRQKSKSINALCCPDCTKLISGTPLAQIFSDAASTAKKRASTAK